MEQSKTSVFHRKQVEANEKETKVALLRTMVRDFDSMIGQLEGQIAAEKDRTRIKNPDHHAYSTFAKAASKRRQNLLISVARMKSMLDVAEWELDQVNRTVARSRDNPKQPTIAQAQSHIRA
jgi:flagellar protein FliJ